jgi:hypothetical protein
VVDYGWWCVWAGNTRYEAGGRARGRSGDKFGFKISGYVYSGIGKLEMSELVLVGCELEGYETESDR